jgi:hypothetical protein
MTHLELLKFAQALLAENITLRQELETATSKPREDLTVEAALAKERDLIARSLEKQCDDMRDHFETRWMREVAHAIRRRRSEK